MARSSRMARFLAKMQFSVCPELELGQKIHTFQYGGEVSQHLFRHIRPLPNLEAKFCGGKYVDWDNPDLSLADQSKSVQTLKQQLKIARHKIFSAKTVRTKANISKQVNLYSKSRR